MAQRFSVEEIVAQVRKVAPFIEGITVSGGEATTQLPFVIALFTAIKSDPALRHLSCLLDSNGLLSEAGWQKLLPVFDGAMLDLKAWGNEHHRFLTGRENPVIKQSIRWLAAHQRLSELRLLVIPERCDYLHHHRDLTAFIQQLGKVPVRINAFHAHGVYGDASQWRSATTDDVEPLANLLEQQGITVIRPAIYL